MNYFTPLSSYKPKHDKMKNCLDFLKIGNYAVININNMFPVPEGEYQYPRNQKHPVSKIVNGRISTHKKIAG